MPPEEKGFVLGFVMISRQSSALAVVVVGLVVLLLLLVVVVKFKALMSAWLIVVVVGSSAFARAKSAHKAKKLTKANADHCKEERQKIYKNISITLATMYRDARTGPPKRIWPSRFTYEEASWQLALEVASRR